MQDTQQFAADVEAVFRAGPWPALHELGLSAADLESLKTQGYLECARRDGEHCGNWRIRFRAGGSLRAVYVGSDPERVARVRRDLSQLQAPCRMRRELRKKSLHGSRILRQ